MRLRNASVLLVGLYCFTSLRAQTELYKTPLYSDPSLVAYYRMEGNANDSKGSNNGTSSNVSYSAQLYGKFTEGASFTGLTSSGNSSIAVNTALTFTDFSVTFWFKTSFQGYISQDGEIFSPSVSSDNQNSDISVSVVNHTLTFTTHNGVTYGISTPNPVTDGNWHHAACIRSGTTLMLYLDGSEVATGNDTGSLVGGSGWGIGYNFHHSSNYYNGYIDDLAVFSRVLTAAEVSNLYTGYWDACTTIGLVCACQSDTYNAVPAFCNANNTCVNLKQGCVGRGVFGLQYECPEYINRYYSQAKGVNTSGWLHTNGGQYYSKAQQFGLVAYPNCTTYPSCASNSLPQPDDIVSFCNFSQTTGSCGSGVGHASIVKSVTTTGTQSTVTFIEENYSNRIDLTVKVTQNPDGTYTMADRDGGKLRALGWLRLPSGN